MTTLQIDIGNSAAKWRLVDSVVVLQRGQEDLPRLQHSPEFLAVLRAADTIWVSCVAGEHLEQTLRSLAAAENKPTVHFARSTDRCGDLKNGYLEPEKIGVDRWLAMVGACAIAEGPLCVADVGSALTIDLIDATKTHIGGYILPGPRMMEQSLESGTARVRYDAGSGMQLRPGRTTADAVQHGIALAMVSAIEKAVALHEAPGSSLLITGGAGQPVADMLSVESQFVEDLVFEGLSIYARDLPEGLIGS